MADDGWSVPESAVYAAAREHLDADDPAVLATVVDVEGNAYRRPGAKMLVGPDGEGIGHVTAGCLESEVAALARDVLAAGRPRVETYDLTEDDDDVWGLGVGCDGIVDVLLEPVNESIRPALEAYDAGEDVGAIAVLSGDGAEIGTRIYYRPDVGTVEGDAAAPDWLREAVVDPARELLDQGGSDTVRIEGRDGTATVFVDAITAPPELVILGSGHDVGPVVELAAKNDVRVTVVGFRGGADLDDRFPRADRTLSTSPANLREVLDVDGATYVVVMTHNFVDDRIAVDEIVRTPTDYVGLMGPRERFEEMLDAFAGEDRTFDDGELEKIYTPVGLDLGAGSPYGIATSIVAEVLAVHADRTPRHLKTREGSIHERVDVDPPDAAD